MHPTQHHFYWDPANALSNYRKHGVLFEDASLAIVDPLAMTQQELLTDAISEPPFVAASTASAF